MGVHLLWRLSRFDENCAALVADGAGVAVAEVMERHPRHAVIASAGCWCLPRLVPAGAAASSDALSVAHAAVLRGARNHSDVGDVSRATWSALALLSSTDDGSIALVAAEAGPAVSSTSISLMRTWCKKLARCCATSPLGARTLLPLLRLVRPMLLCVIRHHLADADVVRLPCNEDIVSMCERKLVRLRGEPADLICCKVREAPAGGFVW